jgi:hypothetical protein
VKHRAIRSSAAGIAGCLHERVHIGFPPYQPGVNHAPIPRLWKFGECMSRILSTVGALIPFTDPTCL